MALVLKQNRENVLVDIGYLNMNDNKELSNHDYLHDMIKTTQRLVAGLVNPICGIKSLESDHLYISPYLVKLWNINLAVSKKVSIWPNYSLSSTYRDDQEIIKTRATKSFLTFSHVNNSILPLLFIKTPIVNPATNDVVGLMYHGYEYTHFDLYTHIYDLFTPKTLLGQNFHESNIKLTNRQKQVVFFFMAKLSSEQIAEQLSVINRKTITKSTVDSIFNLQLYLKFNVVSRVQLYNKLLQAGYSNFLPKALIYPSVTDGDALVII